MRVLVIDVPGGPLLRASQALEAGMLEVDHVQSLPALTDALRQTRYHAVISGNIEGLHALTALTVARLKQPAAARVALLETDSEVSTPALVEVAHRVLEEVPSPGSLQATLMLITARGAQVPEVLAEVVGAVASVPSVTRLLDDLRSFLADPRKGPGDIGRIVGQDPAMAAKVLHLANAGFVRRSTKVTDLRQATALLGLTRLRELILASAAFSAAEQLGADPGLVELAQRHGLAAAEACQRIPTLPPHAATGALLLDIGLPLMAMAWPRAHAEAQEYCLSTSTPLAEEERRRFSATHADAGSLLTRRWSLPYEVTDMVAGHHFIPRSAFPDERAVGFLVHFAAQQGDARGVDPFEPDLSDHVPPWVWLEVEQPSSA